MASFTRPSHTVTQRALPNPMIKNYLLITLRSMMKNKLYISINVLGMGISIASCIIAYFNYDFNNGFDANHLNSAEIYRVNSIREFQNQRTTYGYVPMALGNVVREEVKDVDAAVRYSPGGGNFRIGDQLFNSDFSYVDPEFFNLFTFEFIEGSGDISDKSRICISDEMARKYFGSEPALGKIITQVLDSGRLRQFEVGGVFKKQPSNSSFFTQAFTNFHNQFQPPSKDYHENTWYYRATLFLRVKDPSRLEAITAQIRPFTENNNKVREDFIIREFQLRPFEGMAVADSYDEVPGTWTRAGSPLAAVIGIGMMGGLILLIACFNLTNTSIAISSRRLKEIGIRKVMGSMRQHLIYQFIGETMLVCFISLLVGFALAEWLLIPAFNELWPEMKLTTDYLGNPGFTFFMIGTLLFTGLLAGSYPAFYISRFEPTSILKGTLKFGGTNYFTRTLLTLQFAISLIGIVCSFAFTDNAKFQRDFDLGFDKKGVVYTYVDNRSEYETYRNLLVENQDIISIAGTKHHLYSNFFNDPIKHQEREIEVDILDVGDDYVKTVGLKITKGRDFTRDSDTDRKESVIITEGVARKFDLTDPIGKEIIWSDTVKYYVVGVVQDIYNRGLWEEMSPVMMRYGKKDEVNHVVVSAPVDKVIEVNKFMEAKWKELFPNKLYNGRLMDEEMVEANTVNNNIVKMFVFLGVVAMMLSATGLFTLVSLNIIKRMKEIGVRKVLGASMANISRVINTEFAIILVVACCLGAAGGAWMSAMLMNSIWDYYQEATPVTLVISSSLLLAVCVASVAYKIYNTVRINPALVLRDE
jgi:putative ABC transport system permease protein